MRFLPTLLHVFAGVVLGAVILPLIMVGLFQVFASFGGDIPQLLRRYEGTHGSSEFWAKIFYGVLGGVLGGLTSYFLLCLQNQNRQVWARFCLVVFLCSSQSIIRHCIKFTTDGFNTITEAVVLLSLPTLWFISLLALGLMALKRHTKQVVHHP